MPILLAANHPTLVIRREAFERAGLVRAEIDARLGLTPDEFRVEGSLVVIGPILEENALTEFVAELEEAGLSWFDDVFEMSGNWPEWLSVIVQAR